ncbi:hypothetical protein GCM10010840_30050 [Deinococcus aerolatus]|uniref:Uncharacterized protein n=1 Tax=Deinococcus aerolatus TaxID=522487 RepID=A0ABQ2GDS2_9DEIO|nr:hypothetical protein [Deinococcus aerolatus]GGL90002.1 hypothetical protein GCM10010840_30050 [Deinococcus aerolatus]
MLGLSRGNARSRLIRLTREEPGEDAATLEALFGPLGESWTSFAKNKLRILGWPDGVVEALRGGLALTLASVIVSAPEEHHARLIGLAQQGVSRSGLQAEVQRVEQQTSEPSAAATVARKLSSCRFLGGLKPDERKGIDQWLAKMPTILK